MDMMSDCYLNALEQIIDADPAMNEQLNKAVFHVLHLKNKLGLFEDPYRGLTPENLAPRLLKETRLLSREAAKKTTVLLKNQALLPLQKKQKVALIGPKADSKDLLGAWSWIGKQEEAVSLAKGLSQKEIDLTILPYPDGKVLTAAYIEEACRLAEQSEVVLLALGKPVRKRGKRQV
nr:glycoside hydrolase family 3 C-terminal domain-containing protein [Enterococcus innesii]